MADYATGDGSDQDAQLKNAFNAARNAGGGVVYLPAGEYGVDEGNVFDTFLSGTTFKNGRVTVRGDGRGALKTHQDHPNDLGDSTISGFEIFDDNPPS